MLRLSAEIRSYYCASPKFVNDWMLREIFLFIKNVVSTIQNYQDRARMTGFKAYIATFKDNSINGAGQHNTSMLKLKISPRAMAMLNRPACRSRWPAAYQEPDRRKLKRYTRSPCPP